MTVRNHAVDRLARWMATGVTTAGLTVAIIPLAHGGWFPPRKEKPSDEQSLVAPGRAAAATPSINRSGATVTPVGLRRQPPRQAVVIAPAPVQQPGAAPVYVPQPLYYPAGAPMTQVPPQYNALQQQSGQENSAVARELQRLYEESGRQAPAMPGMPQPQPAPVPQYAPPAGYMPQPGYAPPPGYVAAPGYPPAAGYAPPAGYAPQPVYYPQPGFVPAPGYAPQAMPANPPASQPISTEPAEDPEFFPGDGLASDELGGLEFDETSGAARPAAPQYQQPFVPVPLQPSPLPAGYGFAYPGPAAQQQPTPIITAGIVPPGVEPPPAKVELPSQEELIVGEPIATDYEMSADPKIPKKGFLGRFGSNTPPAMKPPEEPNPYVPNPNAMLLAEDDTIPLAPGADVPGPEQDPAMAEIAKFSNPETPVGPPVVEELEPPVVTPGVRTVPVAAAATVGSAAARKNIASELFKDEEPAPSPAPAPAPVAAPVAQTPEVQAPAIKPAAPKGGIAAGGFAPGKNVVPEQPEPVAPAAPIAATPVPAPVDPQVKQELADSATPVITTDSANPYTGLSLDQPAAPAAAPAAAPLAAREHRGMFFPPQATAPSVEAPAEEPIPLPLPLPLPEPAEIAPPAVASTGVQPVSEAPAAPAGASTRSSYTQSKYEQIASRTGKQGLKGFCPVRLRDHRDLADGQPEYRVQHNGRVYALSSAEALKTFLADPDKYVPAAGGYDVVIHQQSGEAVEGVLDHSAWFKGRLYLFTSADNKDAFVANPTAYAVK